MSVTPVTDVTDVTLVTGAMCVTRVTRAKMALGNGRGVTERDAAGFWPGASKNNGLRLHAAESLHSLHVTAVTSRVGNIGNGYSGTAHPPPAPRSLLIVTTRHQPGHSLHAQPMFIRGSLVRAQKDARFTPLHRLSIFRPRESWVVLHTIQRSIVVFHQT
jgi:hypothetical protein